MLAENSFVRRSKDLGLSRVQKPGKPGSPSQTSVPGDHAGETAFRGREPA